MRRFNAFTLMYRSSPLKSGPHLSKSGKRLVWARMMMQRIGTWREPMWAKRRAERRKVWRLG